MHKWYTPEDPVYNQVNAWEDWEDGEYEDDGVVRSEDLLECPEDPYA